MKAILSKLLLLGYLGFPAVVYSVHIPNPQNPDNARATWGYTTTNGPSTWPSSFATCGGRSQSPVDIKTSTAVTSTTDVGAITATAYDSTLMTGEFSNNGHTFTFTYKSGARPYISGGRLPAGERFNFLQLHWHWGSVSSKGSEHTLDGQEYPAELHLVHWNAKYGDVQTAVTKPDGLAVLGFFYEVSPTSNSNLTEILAIAEMAKRQQRKAQIEKQRDLKNQRKKKGNKKKGNRNNKVYTEAVTIGPVTLTYNSLLPEGRIPEEYYYYPGSLTTPTCDEVVLWTVFTKKVKISEAQLNQLRPLNDADGHTLSDNYRPPQPLSDREIKKRSAPAAAAAADASNPLVVLAQSALAAGIATLIAAFTGAIPQ